MNLRHAALLTLALIPFAAAQPPGGFGGFGGRGGGGFGGGRGMNQHTKILAQFDKDKDGVLNTEERKAARAAIASGQVAGGGRRGFGGGRRGFGGGGNSEPVTPGPALKPSDVKIYGKEPLYDQNVLRTLFLEFEAPDWEQEMADFYHTDVDVPAKLTVDGKSYGIVGVHFRGASSFMMVPATRKRSMSISMDHMDSKQRLYGYKSMDLLNANGDPTFLRTVLYNYIARQYIPAPKANFMRVVINGESWGIYPNAQEFNADLTEDNFKSRKGARWKVPGNPGAQGGLAYLGDSIDAYKQHYEIKTKDDPKAWADFIRLCKTLNQTPPDQLEKALSGLLDVDGALKFLAIDKALINTDGYWVRMSDYSIYEDEKGVFHVLPHDANETLRETEGGFGGGQGGVIELDPFAGADDERKALLSRLLAVPALRTRYLTYMKDIATNWLDWKKVEPMITAWTTMIGPDVKTDGHKLFPYAKFVSTITKDDENPGFGPAGGPELSLKSFFEKRRAYLLNYPEIKKLPAK